MYISISGILEKSKNKKKVYNELEIIITSGAGKFGG